MSEEKLYAVKNAKGLYLSMSDDTRLRWREGQVVVTNSQRIAHDLCTEHGGHVVTLVEEPKKVVLTKEQAKIVEGAHNDKLPACYITDHTDIHSGKESLLMNAYVNGYTMAKEKKYLLPMDGTLEEGDDNDNFQLYAYCYKGRWLVDEVETDPSYKHQTVTQKELETAPAWVKAIKPLEVDDDDD